MCVCVCVCVRTHAHAHKYIFTNASCFPPLTACNMNIGNVINGFLFLSLSTRLRHCPGAHVPVGDRAVQLTRRIRHVPSTAYHLRDLRV